jgi:hypothetical protein
MKFNALFAVVLFGYNSHSHSPPHFLSLKLSSLCNGPFCVASRGSGGGAKSHDEVKKHLHLYSCTVGMYETNKTAPPPSGAPEMGRGGCLTYAGVPVGAEQGPHCLYSVHRPLLLLLVPYSTLVKENYIKIVK